MVEPVDAIIGDFATAGATSITFHPDKHVDRTLTQSGKRAVPRGSC